jgi:ankyrin repeat protein
MQKNIEALLKKYQDQVHFEEIILKSFDQFGISEDSPFHLACLWGEVDDMMIAAGVDVNHKGDIGDTPLHYAVRNQREAVVLALLKAGAKCNLKNDYEDTPLDIAEREGNQKIISLLQPGKAQ